VLATNFQQITKRCLDESSIIHIQQVLENKGTKRCFFSIYENKISLVDLPDIFSLKHIACCFSEATSRVHVIGKMKF
jgi:hypothetical protein